MILVIAGVLLCGVCCGVFCCALIHLRGALLYALQCVFRNVICSDTSTGCSVISSAPRGQASIGRRGDKPPSMDASMASLKHDEHCPASAYQCPAQRGNSSGDTPQTFTQIPLPLLPFLRARHPGPLPATRAQSNSAT